jgi:hypothetical protein
MAWDFGAPPNLDIYFGVAGERWGYKTDKLVRVRASINSVYMCSVMLIYISSL